MELLEKFIMWFEIIMRAGVTASLAFLAFSVLVAGIGFITTRNIGSMVVKAGGMMAFYSFLPLMVFSIPLEVSMLFNDMLHETQAITSDSVDTAVDTIMGDVTDGVDFGQGSVIYLTPEPVVTPTAAPPVTIVFEPVVIIPTATPIVTPASTPLPFPSTGGE